MVEQRPERGRGDPGQRRGEPVALAEAVRLLTGTLDLSEVLQRLTQLVRTRLRVDVARIWLQEQPGEFSLRAQAGVTQTVPHRVHFAAGEGLVGWIIEKAS